MEVFSHHIYEYKKGLRRMILHTASSETMDEIEMKLIKYRIDYHLMPVTNSKFNVFFGDPDCINVIRSFHIKRLSDLSAEQDFIIGALLGYDLKLQSKRYLSRNKKMKKMPDFNDNLYWTLEVPVYAA